MTDVVVGALVEMTEVVVGAPVEMTEVVVGALAEMTEFMKAELDWGHEGSYRVPYVQDR